MGEKKLDPEIADWFSFAVEKASEVAVIAKAVTEGPAAVREQLEANAKSMQSRASFPQTKEIRIQRNKFTKGEITAEEYEKFIEKEIQDVVKIQEELDLDVYVHGEPERNDMVQYFGERLDGYAFTTHAWVQSYGSRCVCPPIVVGDISRPAPMTVKESKYAASIS